MKKMEIFSLMNRKNNFEVKFRLMNFPFFLLLIIIQIKSFCSEYFDAFQTGTLQNGGSIIDTSDYYNISLIITTDKNIYTGIPPTFKNKISSKINEISSAATYSENYTLIACTDDYLLTKINIETGEETPLINYTKFSIPNCTCSISTKNNYVYIGISNLITPYYKIRKPDINLDSTGNNTNELDNLNLTESNYTNDGNDINSTESNYTNTGDDDDNYYIYYDNYNIYLENSVIKIKLIEEGNNGPILDDNLDIINYTIQYKHRNLEHIPLSRPLSCEIVNVPNSEEQRLICGYVKANETSENNFEYLLISVVMNSNFSDIEYQTITKYEPKTMPYIRLQRINSTYIRYIASDISYEIALINSGSKIEIKLINGNNYLHSFNSFESLFFYNNNYLFSASTSIMYIKKNSSAHYIEVRGSSIKKIMGYYESERDILLFIYELNSEIKYFTVENMSLLYDFKIYPKIIEVISNTTTIFDVGKLIESPTEHQHLSFYRLIYYISTTNYNSTYESYNFDKNSQNLTIYESLNDWITFYFYYVGQPNNGLSPYFILENCKVTIRTCLFKCGQCSSNFSSCDLGTCKANFSLYRDDYEGKECYPIEQNFPSYIYDKGTDYFEICYHTCLFCSKKVELSSQKSQNCKVCEDGYLESYRFGGNCYRAEYPYNTSEYFKIVYSINDTNFTLVNSCLKYTIDYTGECVDSCPNNSEYSTYYLNTSFDMSAQQESSMGLLYPISRKTIPKFLFNNICYSTCPELTFEDKDSNTCKCKYAWHKDPETNYTICYNNTDYCQSKEYYYHHDDKECVLNGCKPGYYQINFECYNNSCPQGSRQISSDIKKCESNLKYCFINEYFFTQCRNNKYEGYNFKFNNTNTYLISCNDSIYYFNITTYLYKNTCFQFCPEETIKNDTNDRCSCNYYIYYLDDKKTDYECLKRTEKCWDNKRYNITDKYECVRTKEECINAGYKIFNDECLNECPENTNETDGDGICYCKFYFYNDNNFLNCFEENTTCENEGYPIKIQNKRECFKNKFECIKRGYKFYNNDCIEACPDTTIEKNNDGICSCHYNYFNNSDILDCFASNETCESRGKNYTNIDTDECFDSLEICINRELKIFNGKCYNACPENTKQKEDNPSCICAGYFYTEDNGTLNCFSSGKTCSITSEYLYTNVDTKECFKTRDDCINKGYKVFNFECYLTSCPENTLDKNNDNKCLCSSYSLYTLNDENNLTCFSSGEECASKGYYFDKQTHECFLTRDYCKGSNKKLFGKECVNECPKNSQLKEDTNECECLYYYYNDNGIMKCFNSDKTCQAEGYEITSDTKECFNDINDCFSHNYKYYYEKTCYKENCPSGKIPLNSLTDEKKTDLINELKLNTNNNHLSQKLCVCDTINTYHGWINKDNSLPSIQKCLYQCPTNYELNGQTDKCYYSCDSSIDYNFNSECYKNCPEGTHPSSSTNRTCVCDDYTKNDENGLIICEDIYPELYYEDPNECPCFYNKICYPKCPENTCLTPNNKDLVKCIDINPTIKVVNKICINRIEELIQNLEDDEVEPIIFSSGVAISAFSADSSIKDLIEKYPDLTFVDLKDCKQQLISSYFLPSDTKLYIIGYDTPSLDDSSSINVFNFDIYLKNGTQLKDLSPCDSNKITISSRIKDTNSVYYEKAKRFYGEGYDIYNRSNIFYVDPCAPAQDNGNDITLEDRAKDFYPNVSLCNDGCIYKIVDFTNQRFVCDCNANLSNKIYIQNYEKNVAEENNDSSYLDYFLSLINYKIFLCINLFFQFESFYYNAGFYISFATLLICIMLMILFWIFGMKFLKIQIYKNIPTKEKLLELIRKKKINMNKLNNQLHHHHHHKKRKKHKSYRELGKKTISFSNIINNNEMKVKHKSNNKIEDNKKRNNKDRIIKSKTNRMLPKYLHITKDNLLNNNNNPPPKNKNIIKLREYIKKRTHLIEKKNKKDDGFENFINNNIELNKKDTIDKSLLNDNNLLIYNMKTKNLVDKKMPNNNDIREKKNRTLKSTKCHIVRKQRNKTLKLKPTFIENNSSNENLEIFNINSKKNLKEKTKKIRKEKENNHIIITRDIDKNELKRVENIKKNKKRSKSLKIKKILFNNNSSKELNNIIKIKSIKNFKKRAKTQIIKCNKNLLKKYRLGTDESSIYFQDKNSLLEDLELKIDFNFTHLIDRTDDDIEKREINNIPYRQALRIDKRPFFEILISVLFNQIEFISLFLYRNPYSHYTLTISIYLFELLFDLTMNCILYTDDVVSEKYHNDGDLSMFTSLSLSFISNIISSIGVFIIAKLTNYAEIIEAILIYVKDKKKYIANAVRLNKYIKLRLGVFYFLQLGFILGMTYYLFIFCTVYHQSQGSIMINYIIGACISLAISVGLTLIISILRSISIKYHHPQLFNISKYLYEHF